MDARLRERLDNQAHDHWDQLSIIIVTANLALALVLFGRLINASWTRAAWILLGIGVASVLATLLAYYSIQVGQIMVFGPLRLPNLVVSSAIAASQLALFLWPTHVQGKHWSSSGSEVNELRLWLVLYAVFALAAVAANVYQRRVRHSNEHADIHSYEKGQHNDLYAASVAAILPLACWVGSLWWPLVFMCVGVIFVIIVSLIGIASQASVARDLLRELDETG